MRYCQVDNCANEYLCSLSFSSFPLVRNKRSLMFQKSRSSYVRQRRCVRAKMSGGRLSVVHPVLLRLHVSDTVFSTSVNVRWHLLLLSVASLLPVRRRWRNFIKRASFPRLLFLHAAVFLLLFANASVHAVGCFPFPASSLAIT